MASVDRSNNAQTDDGFPSRLHELRRKRNLSQTEFGKLVGIHYTHIGRYERADHLTTRQASLDAADR